MLLKHEDKSLSYYSLLKESFIKYPMNKWVLRNAFVKRANFLFLTDKTNLLCSFQIHWFTAWMELRTHSATH